MEAAATGAAAATEAARAATLTTTRATAIRCGQDGFAFSAEEGRVDGPTDVHDAQCGVAASCLYDCSKQPQGPLQNRRRGEEILLACLQLL